MMKKQLLKTAAVLLSALMLLVFTGCQSPLGRAMEREMILSRADELDLDEVFSESEGFHFPELTWGMTLEEIRAKTMAPLNTALSYAETGEVTYGGEGMKKKLLGCTDDETCVTVDKDNVCIMVSLIYANTQSTVREIPLGDLYQQYKEKVAEKFGEPEEKEETGNVSGTDTMNRIADWAYTDASGRTTHLQMAAVSISGESEVNYLSLGFIRDR